MTNTLRKAATVVIPALVVIALVSYLPGSLQSEITVMDSDHSPETVLKLRQELLRTQRELERSKKTIKRLKQKQKVQSGCSPGVLKKLHQHVFEINRYFERMVRDHKDDTTRAARAAELVLQHCQHHAETVQAANETIHWHKYRQEPEYGIPFGRQPYYSGDAGEGGIDRMVEIFVDGKRDGMFLELGGLSGYEGNTRYFDERLNWNGVMFEAGRGNWEAGVKARPRIPFYRVALWDQKGKMVDSGVPEKMLGDTSYDRGAGLVAVCAPLASGEKSPKETDEAAPCYPIDYLLAGNPPVKEEYGEFDYVSLDCEGCEIFVVEKWDFKRNPAKVFSIEKNDQVTDGHTWNRIVQIMRKNGYVWFFSFFDGIFLNTRLLYGIEPDAFDHRTWLKADEWTWEVEEETDQA